MGFTLKPYLNNVFSLVFFYFKHSMKCTVLAAWYCSMKHRVSILKGAPLGLVDTSRMLCYNIILSF